MLDYIKALLQEEQTQFLLYAVIISFIGGISNWLMSDRHTIFRLVTAGFLAGFAGLLVGELCLAMSIKGGWAFFICGSAGLAGEYVLGLARKFIIKYVGKWTDQEVKEELEKLDEEYTKNKEIVILKQALKRKLKINSLSSIETKDKEK